ncbi:MAG: pyruvate ferredoxin oxidoreductase [Candidatus Omnitrophota bacterium]|nr:pyruvate ferredoxin oxidoreductase [Candidatus Omnitrophota bacterium]
MVAKTGNEAMAEAMRQINPDVVAAYPITPATEIAQIFASFVADGLVDTEFVTVESEHSAMSACIGSCAAGARTMTATSSQGLALMAEMLYIASGLRLPIVIADVNRALSAPINIHCDHSDTMMVRDAGWIQIFSENAQEAYDNMLQAIRIAEEIKLPVMVTTDGFIISHGMERIVILDDKDAKTFAGTYTPKHPLLDIKNPVTIGALDLQDYYFEHRRQLAQAMIDSKNVILKVGEDFGKRFGRAYKLFDTYKLDDAEVAIVALGSTAGTAKASVDNLRTRGKKAGLLKLRIFRPFPKEELKNILSSLKGVAVMDRSDSINSQVGPLCTEIKAALFGEGKKPLVTNYIYGLGGRDITIAEIEKVYLDLFESIKKGKVDQELNYLGVRE